MPFSKAAAAFVAAAPLLAPRAVPGVATAGPSGERIVMVVDRDDEDADGVPDREQLTKIPDSAALHVVKARPAKPGDASLWEAPEVDGVRVIADGTAVAKGAAIPPQARTIALQATRPGVHPITLFGRSIEVRAFELRAVDGDGKDVDWARSHASFARTPPDPAPIRSTRSRRRR